jgi:alkaline phosphatase
MKRAIPVLLVLAAAAQCAGQAARNVILFLGDAGGVPTLNAASLYRYGEPQKLFIQSLPHVALMDTSAADVWVTDSAAGMTAIVTGHKTNNGVISQSAAAVRGKKDGEILQTILEHAEERGLSTGVLTNMNLTDATAAACYAHSNDRGRSGEIFAQILAPRYGDGLEVAIGSGRDRVLEATARLGLDAQRAFREKGYAFHDSIDAVSPEDRRVVALLASPDFDVWEATRRAIGILSRNPKGYFLMVEWDAHTDNLRRGLEQAVTLDTAIRKTAATVTADTLIIFAADHSFDIRLRGGRRGEPVLPETSAAGEPATGARPNIRVDDGHTGEEVAVAATGPGAERVRGFIANTDLFHIMMAAYGWER